MSDSKSTNKTEFMRYLDAHPEALPCFKAQLARYRKNCRRGKTFGCFIRQNFIADFSRLYREWWLLHPELYGQVYEQQNSLSV